MTIEIRAARASEISALLAIETDAFTSDRLSRRSFRHLFASRSAEILVGLSQGRIVGYCLLLFRRGSSAARLYSIATDRSAKGTGRALLAAVEEAAMRRACRRILLEVRLDNERAKSLYEAYGYRRIGQRSAYYADGATALRYEKLLPSPVETGLSCTLETPRA